MAGTPAERGAGMSTDATSFRRHLSPYGQRYSVLQEEPGLFSVEEWRVVGRPLTNDIIAAAILGQLVAAYFTTWSPRAIALDIDDHAGQGPGHLLSLLAQVRARFGGQAPSLLAESPRGLHAWYFLHWPYPWTVLEEGGRELLAGLRNVELRPTPTLSLRIPERARLVDPDTMRPLPEGMTFADLVADAVHYLPDELFGQAADPRAVRESLGIRRTRFGNLGRWRTLASIEANVAPIGAGETNAALCQLVPCYRSAGMTVQEATVRFAGLLHPSYAGELRDWHRLLGRVRSFYRNPPPTPYTRPRDVQHDLFAEAVAENVAATWPARGETRQARAGATKRRRTLVRIVLGVLDWTGYVRRVYEHPGERAAWNYVYPYFAKNMREGFTPLPRTLLRRFVPYHAERVLPHLEAQGFLTPSPYPYVPGAGICRYYRVDAARFMP